MAHEFRKTKNGKKVNIDEIRQFENSKPSVNEYNMLKKARHGGYVIASPKYLNQEITTPMKSRDFVSMYPATMLLYDYPVSNGKLISVHNTSIKQRHALIERAMNGLALVHLVLVKPRLKPGKCLPFLKLDYSLCTYGIQDNEYTAYNNKNN